MKVLGRGFFKNQKKIDEIRKVQDELDNRLKQAGIPNFSPIQQAFGAAQQKLAQQMRQNQTWQTTGVSAYGRYQSPSEYIRKPTVNSLIGTYKEALKIPKDCEDPKTLAALKHLGTLFLDAIEHPEKGGAFSDFYTKLNTAERAPDGNIKVDEGIESEMTVDKVSKW